jgi:50S ribosomal protein L4
MKIDVYNQNGEVAGSATLPKEIFDVEFNADLVHQIAVSLSANKRQISAHSRTRSEVSGGGKKPWRQKGTGRSRHGSIRSPLWKGGGVTHGPRKDRIFEVEVPKKMRNARFFNLIYLQADFARFIKKFSKSERILIRELIKKSYNSQNFFELRKELPKRLVILFLSSFELFQINAFIYSTYKRIRGSNYILK